MKSKEKKLALNTLILSACTFINKGLLFIMIPLFTRWLSLDDYGLFDVFATYVTLLIPVISLATSNAVFRLSIENEAKTADYICSSLGIVTINLSVVIFTLIGSLLFSNHTYVIPFCMLLIAQVFDDHFQGFLRAIKRIDILAYSRTSSVVLISISATVFILFFKLGLTGLLVGYAFGYVLSDTIFMFKTKYGSYLRRGRYSLLIVKELVSYSWPLIPNDIAWWVINVSDRTIIKTILGTAQNAIYAISYKVPNLCASVFGVFNISWQESASDTINDQDREHFFQSVHDKVVNGIILLCTLVLSFNFLVFDYIFDIRYSNARFYCPILVISIVFNVISLFYGGIQISLKQPQINGLSTMVGAIINLLVHLFFVNRIGLYAAALSTLVSNITVLMIRRIKLNGLKLRISAKSVVLFVILIYYSWMSSLSISVLHSLINIIFAIILCLFVERKLIKKILFRLYANRNRV